MCKLIHPRGKLTERQRNQLDVTREYAADVINNVNYENLEKQDRAGKNVARTSLGRNFHRESFAVECKPIVGL